MLSFKTPIPKPPSGQGLPPFNWMMFTLLVALPVIIIPSFIVALFFTSNWLMYIGIFALTYSACILSIGVYHRYWTHKSFEFKDNLAGKTASFIMRFYGAIVGSLAGQGDAMSWVLRHWKHHLVEDKPGKDHHTPLEFKNKFWGFIWSHVGWMCYLDISKFDYASHSQSKQQELAADKLVVWQEKNYVKLYAFFALGFPIILACLISNNFWAMFSGLPFSWINLIGEISMMILTINTARFLCQHATFLVNSLCHMQGESPYQNHKTGESRDNWLVAILVFGEGFHNGHHAFGYSYEHGIIHEGNKKTWRAKLMYALDIHARIIDMFSAVGLLKFKLKPSDSEVAMAMQKKILFDLERKIDALTLEFTKKKDALKGQISQEIDTLKGKINDVGDEYQLALENLIQKLKQVIQTCKERLAYYKKLNSEMVFIWKARLQKAEKELKHFEGQLLELSSA